MTISPLERLAAIEAIKQLKARYFRYADAREWVKFRDLFTDDLEVDVSQDLTEGGIIHGADAFVKMCSSGPPAITAHHGHMPEIDVLSADSATGIWAMQDRVERPATSKRPTRLLVGWGHYHETYKRIDGTWYIATLKLTRLKVEHSEIQAAS